MVAMNLREESPDIKHTLDRLVAGGHSRKHAKEMVARALPIETHAMFKKGQAFDDERFQRNLATLPDDPKE
ncbi:MAG: hypothetical protein U5R49_10905 [Deltaproteobacteria bacterium]|nr:hypothetical protein [Deltaproteobacteria bacterium]